MPRHRCPGFKKFLFLATRSRVSESSAISSLPPPCHPTTKSVDENVDKELSLGCIVLLHAFIYPFVDLWILNVDSLILVDIRHKYYKLTVITSEQTEPSVSHT